MRKKRNSLLFNQKGVAIIWTAIFILMLTGMTAMAVELGFAYAVSNELKSVADAGALTAAKSYLDELREANELGTPVDFGQVEADVRANVQAIAGRSRIFQIASSPAIDIEVQYGTYTRDSTPYQERTGTQFTDRTADVQSGAAEPNQISAFRVFARRGNSEANRLPFFFARIWDLENFAVERESVSTFAPRNMVLVIDTSASMDDLSYLRPAGAVPPPPWPASHSFVIFPPESANPSTPWYSPYAPGPTDRYAGYDAIMPQPMQTVLDSSLNFLTDLSGQSSFGDQAAVEYFSESAKNKLDLTPVTNANIAGQFQPLLTNNTLYGGLVKDTVTANPPHFVLPPAVSAYDFTAQQYEGPIAIPNGQTNIGDAISLARNTLSGAENVNQSIPVVVLFTDGQPNCAPDPEGSTTVRCFGSTASEDQLERSREYTFRKAADSIEEGILIYPISYGDIDEQSLTMLDEIAYLSGLRNGHFSVGTTTDLEEIREQLRAIFNEIAQLVPFMLAG
jgi:Flp pilus assembly protein TadG